MKCPRCNLIVTDAVPKCGGCDFTLADLDSTLGDAPARTGLLTDEAGLLTEAERDALSARLAALKDELEGEIVVVTVPDARGVKPAQLVFWLFNRWGIGGPPHAGLLILLAKKERRIECEVGFAWEGAISDDESGDILDNVVVPLLREERFAEAITAGVEALAVPLRAVKSGADAAPAEVSA